MFTAYKETDILKKNLCNIFFQFVLPKCVFYESVQVCAYVWDCAYMYACMCADVVSEVYVGGGS